MTFHFSDKPSTIGTLQWRMPDTVILWLLAIQLFDAIIFKFLYTLKSFLWFLIFFCIFSSQIVTKGVPANVLDPKKLFTWTDIVLLLINVTLSVTNHLFNCFTVLNHFCSLEKMQENTLDLIKSGISLYRKSMFDVFQQVCL